MKKIALSIFILLTFYINISAQKDTVSCWNARVFEELMRNTNLIFEGKILTDSVYYQVPPYIVCTYHRVLVLKQFKGIFKSDTIMVASRGGKMVFPKSTSMRGDKPYCHIGDEAVFFASNWDQKPENSNFFYILFGDGCGYITICDKKDVVSEVYEPIENATGQGYVDIHPNSCKRTLNR
jgi:hypothetical protein